MSSFQLSREEARNVYVAGIIPVGHWVGFGQTDDFSVNFEFFKQNCQINHTVSCKTLSSTIWTIGIILEANNGIITKIVSQGTGL